MKKGRNRWQWHLAVAGRHLEVPLRPWPRLVRCSIPAPPNHSLSAHKLPGPGNEPRRPILVVWGQDRCLGGVLPGRGRAASKQALNNSLASSVSPPFSPPSSSSLGSRPALTFHVAFERAC